MSVRLTRDARTTLRLAGISEKQYSQFHFRTDTWQGDACGCPDDRCRDGHHHELDDECGCLPASIGHYIEWRDAVHYQEPRWAAEGPRVDYSQPWVAACRCGTGVPMEANVDVVAIARNSRAWNAHTAATIAG
jgi:hypothetical protein